jgi:hypothetical protein
MKQNILRPPQLLLLTQQVLSPAKEKESERKNFASLAEATYFTPALLEDGDGKMLLLL